jgi:hypothetical protein
MNIDRSSVMAELTLVTDGLLFQSESDYPLTPLYVDAGGRKILSSHDVVSLVNSQGKGPAKIITLEEFFANATTERDWQGPREKETVKKFQSLVQTLKSLLSDIKVFRIGDTEAQVYILGRTASGDFAGVSTKVVET